MIYFDNAATSFKKPKSVCQRLNRYLKKECGNPGRSSHFIASKSAEYVYEAREKVAKLFNLSNPEKVVFTMNATYALNMAIKTLISENSHVIISDVEHNSVMRPIYSLNKSKGVEYSVFNSAADNIFQEIEKHLRKETRAIVCTLTSNVDGRELPFYSLSEIKKKHNLKLIIDASQAAGHTDLNLSKYSYDAIALPAHKGLFGIQGAGVCIFGETIPQESFIEGGSGSESKLLTMPSYLPEKFEAGTLPTPSIIALSAGIDYILSTGIQNIREKEIKLNNALKYRLNDVKGIKIYGSNNSIISFNIDGIGCEKVSAILDSQKICTRAGLHCAPSAHRALGTETTGTVRVSLSYFNTIKEIDIFWNALKSIKAQYK